MNKIIAWNTKRFYSPVGQKIAATKLEDGRVFFVDRTRMLEGVTYKQIPLLKESVMREYDSHNYRYESVPADLEAAVKTAARDVPDVDL